MEAAPVIYACPMVLAELESKLGRALPEDEARRRVDHVIEHAVMIEHRAEIGVAAGRIHREMKRTIPDFGMADAFILASARSKGVRVLTGDPHFRDVPDADVL